MNPSDGPISPGSEPEPSEAEYRADSKRLQDVMEGPGSEDQEHESVMLRAEAMEAFARRQFRRLERLGMKPGAFLEEAGRLKEMSEAKQRSLAKAEDELLEAQANVADKLPQATEAIFAIAAGLRESWEGMDAEEREKCGPLLEEIAEKREQMLADLPIEERRRIEEKYPQ